MTYELENEALETLHFRIMAYSNSKDFDDRVNLIKCINTSIALHTRAKVLEEREACAVLVQPKNDESDWTTHAHTCNIAAMAIRARCEND